MTKRRKAWARSAPTWPQNTIQAPTRKFSKQWPEPQRFPQFLDKTGKMMAVSFNWSADIKTLPNAGDAGFLPVTTRSCRSTSGVFRNDRRRREGDRLAEHPALEGATRDCSRLQPLQLRERARTYADPLTNAPPARRPPPRRRPKEPSPLVIGENRFAFESLAEHCKTQTD